MRTAVHGLHVVGKGIDDFVVAVAVQQRDFGLLVLFDHAEVDRVLVQGREARAALEQVVDKARQTALVAVLFFDDVFAIAQVAQRDAQACIEERGLAQSVFQCAEVVLGRFGKDFGICLEADQRAGVVALADAGQLRDGIAALETLCPDLTAARNLDLEVFRQRVHDRGTHAVQTAGDLVAAAAELAARVQHRQHDRDRRKPQLFVQLDRDTATVVAHRDDIAGQNLHVDIRAETGERFVDGIVDDLVHQVVKPPRACRADVHAGTLAHRFQTLQNLDLLGAVFLVDGSVHHLHVVLDHFRFLESDLDRLCIFKILIQFLFVLFQIVQTKNLRLRKQCGTKMRPLPCHCVVNRPNAGRGISPLCRRPVRRRPSDWRGNRPSWPSWACSAADCPDACARSWKKRTQGTC